MARQPRLKQQPLTLVFAAALVALAAAIAPQQFRGLAGGGGKGDFAGRVVGVSDGDTIKVLRDGREQRVRLWGVDAPESAQAFGTKAKQFTSDLVFGQEVEVLAKDQDRYGRIVAEVRLRDGRWLNEELARAGFAWWYRQYAKDAPRLAAAQAEARQARRGLWADANPVPPWEFRRERRP